MSMNFNNMYGGLGLGLGMNSPYPNVPQYPQANALIQNQGQLSQSQPIFLATFVSNIAEVNSTPADATGKPLFFYNKSKEEIYVKQYDNTGSAPIKTFKLIEGNTAVEGESETVIDNHYQKNFDALNDKIDGLKKFFEKYQSKNEKFSEENEEENEVITKQKGNRR